MFHHDDPSTPLIWLVFSPPPPPTGTARDVQLRAKSVFMKILPELGIGWMIPAWRNVFRPLLPKTLQQTSFFLVFYLLFPWLMGPMEGTRHEEVELFGMKFKLPTAIKAERCRFIESTGCASVCVNSCKVPSQEWLAQDFKMPLHIRPNYDDFSCEWVFGVEPPPLEDDEAVLVPCFQQCDSEVKGEKDALRQSLRLARGVGITAEGKDKYTGESLASIAARASPLALIEAGVASSPMGSASSDASLELRSVEVKKTSKCWSVGEERKQIWEEVQPARDTP